MATTGRLTNACATRQSAPSIDMGAPKGIKP